MGEGTLDEGRQKVQTPSHKTSSSDGRRNMMKITSTAVGYRLKLLRQSIPRDLITREKNMFFPTSSMLYLSAMTDVP